MDIPKTLTIVSIHSDILRIIFVKLKDRDILHLLATCKILWRKRLSFLYHSQVDIFRIMNLPIFDQFTHVVLDGYALRKISAPPKHHTNAKQKMLPVNTRHLTLRKIHDTYSNSRMFDDPMIFLYGISHITHLILDNMTFCIDLKHFSKNLTHLTLIKSSEKINHPETLVSLKIIDHLYSYKYKGKILPKNLKYLYLENIEKNYFELISDQNFLPQGLEILTLKGYVYLHNDGIPPSLKKIILGKNYDLTKITIPLTVEECVVHNEIDMQYLAGFYPHLKIKTAVVKK